MIKLITALLAWCALPGRLVSRWKNRNATMSSEELLARIAADTTDRDVDRFLPPAVRRYQRCCFLGDEGSTPCSSDATVEIVDGDPRASTYACDEHRGAFAGQAWSVRSG